MTSELIVAINQIAAERGIEKEEVFKALESSILSAIKKEKYGRIDRDEDTEEQEGSNLAVEVDRESGEFRLFATKVVVDSVKDEEIEIALNEAELISPNVELGDSVEIEMPSDDLGRIATQTAKQVLLQKIRESEKEAVISEFNDKIGEVFTALMQRMQKGMAVMEIGKATAYMPQEEQISNEFYRVGDRYKVLLKSIVDSSIIVSRADPQFLIELFKLEVPEIESGVVEIKAVAREAGSRSKIAVVSHQDGIDPIGSCVGQRGMRIANIMNELGEEKIDIIEWDEDVEKFVANALSPAKVESVDIEDDTATVVVPSDQLSLAIGRDGQNVRLAWKLTDIKIDIEGEGGETVDIEGSTEEKELESEEDTEKVDSKE
ncbi:transcription termination/antitermination protein NusA [Candidatus Dojkabacteria bacterium]|uniref:Transcription termination/antitermination protein NusA n=1 Tax=Candidatus Dojkabacteria bacterium TaxID=2099670 RepID=A0A847VCF4_9BACT|nr:transcription termination/antitermination protein NusA [Candidatus Dojkabacteria bacterium]